MSFRTLEKKSCANGRRICLSSSDHIIPCCHIPSTVIKTSQPVAAMEKAFPIGPPIFLRSCAFALSAEPDNARFDDPLQNHSYWTFTKHYSGHIHSSKTFDSFYWRNRRLQHHALVSLLYPTSSTQNFGHIKGHSRHTRTKYCIGSGELGSPPTITSGTMRDLEPSNYDQSSSSRVTTSLSVFD